eukprot:9184308-Ditylum_brightwellii.AAC.1
MKHLLLLREQIAPFNVEFATTYKELDFTHMRVRIVFPLLARVNAYMLSICSLSDLQYCPGSICSYPQR